MKTLKFIQKEISDTISEIKQVEKNFLDKNAEKQGKRLRLKLSKLKFYEMYLKTNPTDEFCKKEIKRI